MAATIEDAPRGILEQTGSTLEGVDSTPAVTPPGSVRLNRRWNGNMNGGVTR